MLFLIADGVHARFVRQEPGTGRFSTVGALDSRSRPASQANDSRPTNGHDTFNRAADPFAAEVAQLASGLAKGARDGIALVAPGRLVPPLRKHLHGLLTVAAVLPRDLTRTPDSELGQWLTPLAVRAERQLAVT